MTHHAAFDPTEVLAALAAADLSFVVTDERDHIVFCGAAARADFRIHAGDSRTLSECLAALPVPVPEAASEMTENTDILVTDERGDRWLRASARPRCDGAQRICGAVTTFEDVTREHELVRGLYEMQGLGVMVIDAEGRIRECNAASADILGSSRDRMEGTQVRDHCTPTRGNAVTVLAADGPAAMAISTKRRCDAGTRRIERRDGTIRWARVEAVPLFAASGVVTRALVTLHDTTSLHDGEEALRHERRRLAHAGDRFRRVVESVPDAIAVYHENRFGYANAALAKLFGYASVTELVGKETTKVLPGHTLLGSPSRREETWRLGDGTMAVVEIATHPIDLDGEQGTLLIARDVSERKHVQAQLIQSSRLASLGTLAAGIAHEINNPLAYVISNLELLAGAIGEQDASKSLNLRDLADMTAHAKDGAERVRKIVRGLKIFARADEERRVVLDVRAVVDLSVDMAFNEIRHRARLVKEYGDTPRIEADAGRLAQVFINLLVNAAQSIPEGQAERNEIRIVTSTDAAGRAVVTVTDSGAGITADIVDRIFEPFFTTKAVGVGTGLGLSISHGIVADLGGELTVKSTVGKGTEFRVALPAAAASVDSVKEAGPVTTREPSVRPRARVLIMDDDAHVVTVLCRILGRDHDVVATTDAREALALIAAGDQFDVILCDLMMPDMTGMDFHAALAEIAPGLARRVIFMTGGAFTPTAKAFLDRVRNTRVEKPFDAKNLLALVSASLPGE
jgi:two-component system, cell cycle sensor histidine kinase and response regulator CckA